MVSLNLSAGVSGVVNSVRTTFSKVRNPGSGGHCHHYHVHARIHGKCSIRTILKLVLAIVAILGKATLITWLVLRPTGVKLYVAYASIARFDLANTNTLLYDLKLIVAVRNPNGKMGVEYHELVAAAYWAAERFGWVELPGCYQGHKNTTILQPAFSGQSLVATGDLVAFNQQKASGFFYVDVKIKTKLRFKIGQLKTPNHDLNVLCRLKVPLEGSSVTGGFTRTKCDEA